MKYAFSSTVHGMRRNDRTGRQYKNSGRSKVATMALYLTTTTGIVQFWTACALGPRPAVWATRYIPRLMRILGNWTIPVVVLPKMSFICCLSSSFFHFHLLFMALGSHMSSSPFFVSFLLCAVSLLASQTYSSQID